MKKLQRILIICAVLIMMSITTYAVGTGICLEKCIVDGSFLRVLCSDIDPDADVEADAFALTLDGTQLPVAAVSTVREEKIPVTVYCLVDVSGSMKSDQMRQAKEVLNTICEEMEDTDNMVIATLGNQTETSGFLSDQKQLKTAIEQLEAGNEDTNLYAGIQESIGILNADTHVNPKRCLLILSDGDDDQKSGITREEAERAVKEAHLSVYTVATLPENPGAEGIENGKVLGSFARISAAGVHYVPAVDGISGAEAGQDIMKHIYRGIVLKAELPSPASDRDRLKLCMTYTGTDDSRWEDAIVVYAKDLYGEQTQESTTERNTETADAESGDAGGEKGSSERSEEAGAGDSSEEGAGDRPEEESFPQESTGELQSGTQGDVSDDVWGYLMSENRWVWIVSGVAVLLLAVAVIALIVRNRKKKAAASEDASSTRTIAISAPGVAQGQAKTYSLSLLAIGYADIAHPLELPENREVTVGRNGRADIILDADDKKLSGVHCAMKWENGKIYIRDLDSTNGTYVNGVPIRPLGRVAVHKGETVTLGSYEYRIG